MTENDMKPVYDRLNQHIKKFKAQHPDSPTIVNTHLGKKLYEPLLKHVKDIDLIVNGHDHADREEVIGKTLVVSCSQDNDVVKVVDFNFDDNGKFIGAELKSPKNSVKKYYTENVKISNNNPIKKLAEKTFKDDIKPVISLLDSNGKPVELLRNGNSIRYENSTLANCVTSWLAEATKKIKPELDTFAISAANFKGDLKHNSSNLDIISLLNEALVDLSNVMMAKKKGSDIIKIVEENIKNNLISPTRKCLWQFSNIQVMRSAYELDENQNLRRKPGFENEITVKIDKDGNGFKAMNPDADYNISFVEKNLITHKLKEGLERIGKTLDELLRSYLKEQNYKLVLTKSLEEAKRII